MEPDPSGLADWMYTAVDSVYRSQLSGLVHEWKNSCFLTLQELRLFRQAGSAQRVRIIDNMIRRLEQDLERLQSMLQESGHLARRVDDLNALINEVVKSLAIRSTRVTVGCYAESKFPPLAIEEADVRSMVYNLLSNAFAATAHTKSPRVDIRTGIRENKGIEVIFIQVTDNGMGIRHEHAEQIYERLFSTRERGTGMGLFLTRHLAAKYGGEINHTSTVGKGTAFTILIPLRRHIL